MRYLVLLAIVSCIAGCRSRGTDKPDPYCRTLSGESCWVIMAKYQVAGEEPIILGPYYSKERPVQDYSNGDVAFINMETNRPFIIPGQSNMETRITEGFKY